MNLQHIFLETLRILNDTSIYLLLGFFVAGLLKFVLTPEKIQKHLGQRNTKSVFFASLWGIPLPLCSCGVLPTAISLQKEGAAKGSTISFLISTPETGVDSIAVTYALMDPLTTIFRPMAAFSTAIAAGVLTNLVDGQPSKAFQPREPKEAPYRSNGTGYPPVQKFAMASCRETSGGESLDGKNPGTASEEGQVCPSCAPPGITWKAKAVLFFRYAYQELIDDVAFWLIISIVIAGFISALVPSSFIQTYLGSGLGSMLFMLAVGIPLYVCATSSTPIAAALILKGLNPGAALVFLLSGPATNAGAVAMVARFLGGKIAVTYVGTIALMSLFFGFLLNQAYALFHLDPIVTMGMATELMPAPLKIAGSVALSILLLQSLNRSWKNRHYRE